VGWTYGTIPCLDQWTMIMNKRKIIIGAVTLGCVLVVFGIYNLVVDTPTITFDNQSLDKDSVKLPNFDEKSGNIDGTKIGNVGRSQFIARDKKTKKIKRILSFESLEDPVKGTDLWRLNKPRMKILGDIYECDIQSDRGRVRVETVLGDVSPSMAELNDNVVITIHTKKDNRTITVTLDDLVYDAERCEFASEGPVKVVGNNGVMEGTGLIMIYDGQLGKLAYLEIRKLDYLRIKNVAKKDEESTKTDSKKQASAADAGQTTQTAKAAETNQVVEKQQPAPDANQSTAKGTETSEDEKYNRYECRMLDNVNIEYGKRLVIVGADEVTISNILWSDDEVTVQDGEKKAETPAAAISSTPAVPITTSTVTKTPKVETKKTEAVDETEDVYVTCKGSLIVRPMEMAGEKPGYFSRDTGRKMEFTGTPVRIGQLINESRKDIEPIASCGAMTYDLDQDVLDLVTNDTERYVELNMRQNEANIYTQGSVKWNRRDNNAVIKGPGVLLVDELAMAGKTSDMKFDGLMNIFFAEKGAEDFEHRLSLSSVNLVGGMVANLNKDGKTTVKSDLANFYFGGGQDITRVDLNGNVDLSSENGGLKSDNAMIYFGMDESGENVPVKMSGSGNTVLEPKQISSTRPIRFHSRKIDYDMITGSAVATGPVEFIFYEPDNKDADPSELKKEKAPIIITAEDNAKFFPDKKQFVFNGNVVGTKRVEHEGFVQREKLYGEKLIVDIAPSKEDESKDDIKHIRVVGGLVELRSKRTAGDVTVSHVGLSCMQIDWDAETEVILAKGPGEILLNNENAPEPEEKAKEDRDLNLSGPCVASISGFQTLKWDTLDHTIFTDGGDRGQVEIGYRPIKNGVRGRIVQAASRHITSRFAENAEKKFDIVSLDCKDGFIYKEVGLHNMMGDSMHYDGADGIMVIKGTDTEDCLINGARMPHVEYNMKTGRTSSKLSSRPGTIRMR